MLKVVENLRKSLWRRLCENGEKVSTFLTKRMVNVAVLWRNFSFTRVFRMIYTMISTRFEAIFTEVFDLDFHFSTEPITITTNNIKERN